jgi:phosphate/sulfate permease
MAKTKKGKKPVVPTQPYKFRKRFSLLDVLFQKEKKFLYFIAFSFIVAGMVYPYASIAMWVGFLFAAYSAIANDSIQTIGTFIVSNEKRAWYWQWLFMGSIFLATVFYSWYMFNGDVTYQRLSSKGFDQTPDNFVFLQLAAPIILLLLTRFRIPVSTTFMLLSVFTVSSGAIVGMINKSLLGYVAAFSSALIIYLILSKVIKRFVKGEAHGFWTVAQWVVSGFLWHTWLAQDLANVAVYLPRSLNIWEFVAFAGFIFLGMGFLFFKKGEKIQEIINEKSDVRDVRSATIIDLIYAIILYFFKELNNMPMSTTWVFIGLLAGRELGMRIRAQEGSAKLAKTFSLIGRDILSVTIGLIISVIMAIAINPVIQKEIFSFFFE